MSIDVDKPFNSRVRASELTGRAWLNTGGKDLKLGDLRGKIVVLDFWTFCCINCLHVLDELRPLEEKYADVLVTVGVHSPKFDHEADPEALLAAVERYEVHHPVLDDPELKTWSAYAVRAWPTLVVIDPEGYMVASLSGEGHAAGLDALIQGLVAEHEARGTLHRGSGPYVPPEPQVGTLRFPGKALPLQNAESAQVTSFLVADTGHHRLVELEKDLHTVRRIIGTGEKGHIDGPAVQAQFYEPQGLAQLPGDLAQKLGYDVVIADAVNHRLRGLHLATGEVQTLAGTGEQRLLVAAERMSRRQVGERSDARATALSSPWDVVYSPQLEQVVIAMAGTHQIFGFDPVAETVQILAGTGAEGLVDGPPEEAWFAQPSGLALDSRGDIWVADSETSALRVLRVTAETRSSSGESSVGEGNHRISQVETVIGEGLFDFGFNDGPAAQARLQHPLGVGILPDDSVVVADTYNGAIRRYHPAAGEVSTIAMDLAEPADAFFEDEYLVVVDTNRHQLLRIGLPEEAMLISEGPAQTQRSSTPVRAGNFPLLVDFTPPEGQKLDTRWGDPTQLKISATPENLLLAGAGTSPGLRRELILNPELSEGVLHIAARAAACDGDDSGDIPEHAACHLYQQDWGIPVTVTSAGEASLRLDLRGMS